MRSTRVRTTSAGEEPKGTPVKPLGRWILSARAERVATRKREREIARQSIVEWMGEG